MKKFATLPVLVLLTLTLFVAGCGGSNLFNQLPLIGNAGFCMTIVLILDLIALVEIFGSSRSTGDKLLWALIIIFFPILGCILYYALARKK